MALQVRELPFITKIIIPERREHILRRDRLLESLSAGLNKKVQIVSAPAGYGKTALLTEFASGTLDPVCWYSFAPEDYDPEIFLRYCLQSIRSSLVDFGESYPALSNPRLQVRLAHSVRLLHKRPAKRRYWALDLCLG